MSTIIQSSGVGVQGIPAGSRKMVQSLKEIVPCSDSEIYAVLKECNMDANEAVNRLLTQDPFREVKSKREKKKEGKETDESRPRGANNASNRGGRIGSDRYRSRGSSTQQNSSESANFHGKSSFKKENGSTLHASSLSSVSGALGNNRSRAPPGLSDGAPAENKESSWENADPIAPSTQLPSGYQSAWASGPGQVSMADIVKMGRPQNKPLHGPNSSQRNVQSYPFAASDESGPGISSVQTTSTNEEWPSIEKPAATLNAVSGHGVVSLHHPEASVLPYGNVDQHSNADDVRDTEGGNSEYSGANDTGSNSLSSEKMMEDESRGVSPSENNLYRDTGLYQPQQGHAFEYHEVEEVDASLSSVTRNLQQLGVDEDERELQSEECVPSVVIPDHLQVRSADCLHLSFGTFGSGIDTFYSSGTTSSSVPVKATLDEAHSEAGMPPAGHSETRQEESSEYYVDDSLGNASDGTVFRGSGGDTGSYDPSSVPQQEELKHDDAEEANANQYPFPPGERGYAFDDAQHLNSAFSQTSSHVQNLAALPNVMQSYNSLQNTLSAAGAHSIREADLPYSPFPVTQSTPAKYANSVSTIGGSTISMSEALIAAGLSPTQPAPQTISGANVATGPPLPQHLAVHPYSQAALSLGPYANIMGYPFLPQSYTYLPQAFAGNSAYHHQSLPQFNKPSANSLPQSAAGYGAFGNSSAIPGNFQMNPQSGTNLSYDDILSSQYKDNSHLVSLQQGLSSRTMSGVPGSGYYNYPGQNQQPSGFRQGQQQPSQNYGYANFYHSQTGIPLDQQQHNVREGSVNTAQGGQPKQSQIWPNGY